MRELRTYGSVGVAPSKHGGIQWNENATSQRSSPPVSTSLAPNEVTLWVKRRQGVCGPEQACEWEIIAPKSNRSRGGWRQQVRAIG